MSIKLLILPLALPYIHADHLRLARLGVGSSHGSLALEHTPALLLRPITCLNDIIKVFDGCLYYSMARRTGTVVDPECLGGGQFLLRVTVNGDALTILYDSGASLCFARTDLPMLANAKCAQRDKNQHLVEGGPKIRLVDDSNVVTSAFACATSGDLAAAQQPCTGGMCAGKSF